MICITLGWTMFNSGGKIILASCYIYYDVLTSREWLGPPLTFRFLVQRLPIGVTKFSFEFTSDILQLVK
jgi:hypothetical protein